MQGYVWKKSLSQSFHNRAYTRLIENPDTAYEIDAVTFFTREVVFPSYRYGFNQWLLPAPDQDWSREPYIVFAISSMDLDRIWPSDRFACLANHVPDRFRLVFTGVGEADAMRVSSVISLLDRPTCALDLVGKTKVVELACIISRSRLVVGNDSSAVHIAAATHVPSLCITRLCEHKRFVPYPEGLPYPAFSPRVVTAEKLSDVSVEMAINALDEMLVCHG